jgi:O-antigen/teichoic acid export membrane protein
MLGKAGLAQLLEVFVMTPVSFIKNKLTAAKTSLILAKQRSKLFKHFLQLLKEYGAVVIGVGATRLLTFIASVILARKLRVEDFGAFSIAYTLAMLIGQLPSVLDTSFVRHYAMSASEAEKCMFVKAHLYIKLAVFGLITLVAFVSSDFLAVSAFGKADLGQILLLATLAGGFFSVFTTGLAYYQGGSQFLKYAALYFVESLIGLLAIGAYIGLFAPSALGAIGVYTVVFGALGAATSFYLYMKSHLASAAFPKSHFQQLLGFGSWLIPASLCYILLQRIDLLLLARFVDYTSLGLYGAAVRVVAIFSLFTGNLPVIFLPKAAEAIKSPQAIKIYLLQSSLATLGILVIIASGVLWAPKLLSILGPDYTGATGLLRVLLLSYVFIAISSPLSCLIYGIGRTDLIFAQRLLELGVAVVTAFILMPLLADLGAALSMATAYFMGASFVTFNAYRWILKRVSWRSR